LHTKGRRCWKTGTIEERRPGKVEFLENFDAISLHLFANLNIFWVYFKEEIGKIGNWTDKI
jgi:hypothetical protein